MRVLLTGSAGFIGSVVQYKLLNLGHNVVSLDKKIGVDVRDFFRENDRFFDLVIHCAAQVGGRLLIESPLAHAENLEIDAGLFQWAERTKPSRIVYVSSVAAYPVELQLHPNVLWEEDVDLEDIRLPDHLYGWAKLTGEYLASRCSVPVSIPRPFTVYGEGQDEVFPFANLIKQVRERSEVVAFWGSGNQVRDFIHIDDVADGILAMAEKGVDGAVNFCTGHGTSLKDLAWMMTVVASRQAYSHYYNPEIRSVLEKKPEGLPFRVGHSALLREFYEPKVSLEEGIERGLR